MTITITAGNLPRLADKAYQLALDEGAYAPLFYRPSISAWDSKVADIFPSSAGVTWNAFEWTPAGMAPPPLPDTSKTYANFQWPSSSAIDGQTSTGWEAGIEHVTDQYLKLGIPATSGPHGLARMRSRVLQLRAPVVQKSAQLGR